MENNKRFRLRLIVPAFPNYNIYSFAANCTTALGPLYVAANANKLQNWDVEVIDENNCHGRFYPGAKNKKIDHEALQKERAADVVGFYGSISSTAPRLYELAGFYKKAGAVTISGGKHVENLPEEALDNNIDIVVFREGEITIKEILLSFENKTALEKVAGIAFLKDNKMFKTTERELIENFDDFPYPDFNLLRYAKIKIYPINRTRGCNSRCEFCAVKERARCSSPEKMMEEVKFLVETRGAKSFFEASDHFAANRAEAIEFCRLLAEYQKKYKKKLNFTVQTRITDAKYPELLAAMREANINTVCIGYESPIDEELLAMRKGYLSKDLYEWTETFHKYKFYIHGMFIFGYPRRSKEPDLLTIAEKAKRFRRFIKKAKIDTVQILNTIPLPGTELWKRLESEKRLYPLSKLGWEYYDGQFPVFEPDDGVTPEEMQKIVNEIMHKFYDFKNLLKIMKNILLNFPGIVITSSFTIIIGKVRYITGAYRIWHRKYFRNYFIRFGGYIVLKKWLKNFKDGVFLKKLEEAKLELSKNIKV